MGTRNFREMLEVKWAEGKFACAGLDSSDGDRMCAVVDATHDLVCAYKPNTAFYEAWGAQGWETLLRVTKHIRAVAPTVPVILDGKRTDIGSTNLGYVQMAFEYLGADAITVNPYFGQEALEPFLCQKEKGIIVLCRTSNKGAGEFQDLAVHPSEWTQALYTKFGGRMVMPLYQYIANQVSAQWNKNGNCALVVGATYPGELAQVRHIVGDMPILIPGIGTQGGDLKEAVLAGKDSRGWGIIINYSRGIIRAPDPRKATEEINILTNQYLKGGVA